MSDANSLLKLLKENEVIAYKFLYNRYYKDLLLYCHRIVKEPLIAEDIVQECFVDLWYSKRLVNFTGDLDSYLFRTVRNRSLKYNDKNYKVIDAAQTLVVTNNIDSETILEQEDIDKLYFHINKLPEKCKEIFLMACLQNKKYQEIADELNVSINTVKTQMKIALKTLRDNLKGKLFLNALFIFLKKKFFSFTLNPKYEVIE